MLTEWKWIESAWKMEWLFSCLVGVKVKRKERDINSKWQKYPNIKVIYMCVYIYNIFFLKEYNINFKKEYQ